MPKRFNLIGKKFHRLTILSFSHINKRKQAHWRCLCKCGTYKTIQGNLIVSGHTKSCGCFNLESIIRRNTTHNLSETKSYQSWCCMKGRCCNPNNKNFSRYGGRGIKICSRWLNSFENFYADMGDKPKGLTLERINNDGNYEPSNCCWVTRQDQANNMSTNHSITINGETHNIAQWERIKGFNRDLISTRINRYGWSPEKAILTPARKRKLPLV